MSLVETIKKNRIMAMKTGAKDTLSTLRLLLSELDKERVIFKLQDVSELSDEQVQTVISRQIKKLDKEIEAYEAVGRETDSQNTEKELLMTYLPKQLTKEEIREIAYRADSLYRRGEIDQPQRYLAQRLKGKADMRLVMQILKEVQQELDNAGE